MSEDFTFWRDQLAGKNPELDDKLPRVGFYRKVDDPVMIRVVNGVMWAWIGRKGAQRAVKADDSFAETTFSFFCRNAITSEVYEAVANNNALWPDAPPDVNDFRPFRDTGYLISRSGQVMGPRGNILTDRVRSNGYLRAQLGAGREESVHRMVAIAFIGEPPTSDHQVDHINGVRDDNRVENLRWVTKEENLADREFSEGEDHYASKLTEDQVREIRSGDDYRGRTQELADRFGVSTSTISDARAGRTWRSLSNLPDDPVGRLFIDLESHSLLIAEFLKSPIDNEENATKAGLWSKKVDGIGKELDGMRDAEKRPHDEAAAAVQAKFKPKVDLAKDLGGVDGFDQDECGCERDDGCEVSLGLLAA